MTDSELDALRNPDGTYHADPMGTSWNRTPDMPRDPKPKDTESMRNLLTHLQLPAILAASAVIGYSLGVVTERGWTTVLLLSAAAGVAALVAVGVAAMLRAR